MIAEFPNFSPLQLGDRPAVQALTRPFAPYSDFNFTSLYSWDTRESVRVSVLHGNLVVRFSDYTSGEPFYSFIGDKNVDDTATRLLELAESEGLSPELRLVPEVAAWRASPGAFEAFGDDDNSDYILSVERLKAYQGNKLGPKRNFVNRFNKEYEAHVAVVDLADVAIQTRFLDLFHRWWIQKGERAENAENELSALHRAMFAARSMPDLFTVASFVEGDLVGFSINEILGNGYAMIHFEKADASYVGVYAHLMQQMACMMSEVGCRYINYEQDLGVFGLRKGKRSYVPQNYLRKYALRISAEATATAGRTPASEAGSPYVLLEAGQGLLQDFAPRDVEPRSERRDTLRSGPALEPEEGAGPASSRYAESLDLPPLSRREGGKALGRSGEWPVASATPTMRPPPPAPPSQSKSEAPRRAPEPWEEVPPSFSLRPPPSLRSLGGGSLDPLAQTSERPCVPAAPPTLRRLSRVPIPCEEGEGDTGTFRRSIPPSKTG